MNPHLSALAWTLIHFVWEGSLIALVLALALRFTSRNAAALRYLICCGALLLMLASAVGTFIGLDVPGTPVTEKAYSRELAIQHTTPATLDPQSRRHAAKWLPWLVYFWTAGVLALSIRTGTGFIASQRLKHRQTTPLEPVWQGRFDRLARRLEIARRVRACQSAIVEVPAVIGWFRPVVLVPASAVLGLPPPDLEALLAHELAHVRRHDYLVNLLQTAVETLLFYHPAVWWTGQKIRVERENCCDDLAVSVCGDVLMYARALTRLEQLRAKTPVTAMAANHGSLLARIHRLVRPDDMSRKTSGDWMTGVAILVSATAIFAGGHVPLKSLPQRAPNVTLIPMIQPVAFYADPAKPDPFPQPEPQETPSKPPAAPSFLDGLAAEGFKSLDVDQLIAFKIHGVTPEYIRALKAAGIQPTAEQVVEMRIHGVEPTEIAAFKAAGFSELDAEKAVELRIHGVTPEYARDVKALSLGDATLDDLVSMRIHGVTPEFAREMKALKLDELDIERLIELRIHDVSPAFIRDLQNRGFKNLTIDHVVRLKQLDIF